MLISSSFPFMQFSQCREKKIRQYSSLTTGEVESRWCMTDIKLLLCSRWWQCSWQYLSYATEHPCTVWRWCGAGWHCQEHAGLLCHLAASVQPLPGYSRRNRVLCISPTTKTTPFNIETVNSHNHTDVFKDKKIQGQGCIHQRPVPPTIINYECQFRVPRTLARGSGI